MTIHVVGGLYRERCAFPLWDNWYGSGGRAASALATRHPDKVTLHTYFPAAAASTQLAQSWAASRGIHLQASPSRQAVVFDYLHCLSTPKWFPVMPTPEKRIEVQGKTILKFGFIEGDARVHGRTVVFDPQSPQNPIGFKANGSQASRLAIIANRQEICGLAKIDDLAQAARRVLQSEGADVVVVKAGERGLLVHTVRGTINVPAYQSTKTWVIGSGDMFAAAFVEYWAIQGKPPAIAADLASRSVAIHADGMVPTLLPSNRLKALKQKPARIRPGRVYLAGPFFHVAQRWLINEAREYLLRAGLKVFSPIHDVGIAQASRLRPWICAR